MNELKKLKLEKKTENGDVSYKSTGDKITDLFFLTEFFANHLDSVKIGDSEKEKILSMFIRDPRYGLGFRDLGRVLMEQSNVSPSNIVKAGRYDDLYHIASDECLLYLKDVLDGKTDTDSTGLAKKWMPRLCGKDKRFAKALCKLWGITEKEYRALIKNDSTVEYKLSYCEKDLKNVTPLDNLFNENEYIHPLVDTIEFEKVPSLAMKKYIDCFSTRDDIKDRFNEYMNQVKENKAKVNVSTTNVVDAHNIVTRSLSTEKVKENKEILGNKIVENAILDVKLNCIPILDTSGSMYWGNKIIDKANAIAHALAKCSTYAPNKVVSFSSHPRLLTIKGETLAEQYRSMYTGDCSNTDFGAVMELLSKLETYPDYLVVLSDMEFDEGSSTSKNKTMSLFKSLGAQTKIIWWNLNGRNATVPEFDEYGNIFLSGYNMQILKLLENEFDMSTYIDKILSDYCKKINLDTILFDNSK